MVDMSNVASALGKAGEYLVTADLLARGCQVYKDVTDATVVDLLVLCEDKYFRIQVKTTTSRDGVAGLPLFKKRRTKDGFNTTSYLAGNVDVMALVVMDRREIVYLACQDIDSKMNVSVRFDPPKNNQRNVRYAKDMTFEKAFRK